MIIYLEHTHTRDGMIIVYSTDIFIAINIKLIQWSKVCRKFSIIVYWWVVLMYT